MIQKLLGIFGYVKVPLAAVRISMQQEAFLEKVQSIQSDAGQAVFAPRIKAQKALTFFLRSGRAVTYSGQPEATQNEGG